MNKYTYVISSNNKILGVFDNWTLLNKTLEELEKSGLIVELFEFENNVFNTEVLNDNESDRYYIAYKDEHNKINVDTSKMYSDFDAEEECIELAFNNAMFNMEKTDRHRIAPNLAREKAFENYFVVNFVDSIRTDIVNENKLYHIAVKTEDNTLDVSAEFYETLEEARDNIDKQLDVEQYILFGESVSTFEKIEKWENGNNE
ncbi:hypothetical protein [Brochothrix thermosphacta]|uniref:Uncharacterized protein n=1 Tax=Brochothrix thermosphacta TaxID=2756 RepID=A0A2X0S894_BROTH|nr:hypothetical protein [Brochothrix thermosphacta]SPP28862.1 hypothetical protein BTBSAS_30180 [Brochothrix thermosphacta]